MGRHLERPFDNVLYYEGPAYVTAQEEEQAALAEQKTKDTDGDELTDYDELYIYKTSPYLADSDSDGLDDKAEVFAGQDPNCPAGKECGAFFASADAAGSTLTATDLVEGIPGSTVTPPEAGLESEEQLVDFLNQMSANEIRSQLIAGGIPEETLNMIDDESLMQLFAQTLGQMEESGELSDLVDQVNAAQARE